MVCKWPSPIFNISLNLQGICTLTPLIASKYSNPITLPILLIFHDIQFGCSSISNLPHRKRDCNMEEDYSLCARYIYNYANSFERCTLKRPWQRNASAHFSHPDMLEILILFYYDIAPNRYHYHSFLINFGTYH